MHCHEKRSRVCRLTLALTAICWLGLLSGCGIFDRTQTFFGGNLRIEVKVEDDTNRNSPVAVDILVVYRRRLLEEILERDAAAWFAQRDQFLRDYPGDFDSWLYEWAPGQEERLDLDFRARPAGAVIFADYDPIFFPGKHRIRIDPYQAIWIQFAEADFAVDVQAPPRKRKRKKKKKARQPQSNNGASAPSSERSPR